MAIEEPAGRETPPDDVKDPMDNSTERPNDDARPSSTSAWATTRAKMAATRVAEAEQRMRKAESEHAAARVLLEKQEVELKRDDVQRLPIGEQYKKQAVLKAYVRRVMAKAEMVRTASSIFDEEKNKAERQAKSDEFQETKLKEWAARAAARVALAATVAEAREADARAAEVEAAQGAEDTTGKAGPPTAAAVTLPLHPKEVSPNQMYVLVGEHVLLSTFVEDKTTGTPEVSKFISHL
jgi:hypothetical protein